MEISSELMEMVPEGVRDHLSRLGSGAPPPTLEQLLPGAGASTLKALRDHGMASIPTSTGEEQVMLAQFDADGNVFALAAGMPRKPGRAESYLRQVQDFTDSTLQRDEKIKLYWNIYRNEAIPNNATNKLASLIATEGSFQIRYVRGARGKSPDAKAEEFRQLLQFWAEKVNARPLDAVMTGTRGVKALINQGARQALIEGDNIMRQVWQPTTVPALGGKKYSLPINIQTFSAAHVEVAEEFVGTNYELMYWKPPQEFVKKITEPKDPLAKKMIQKLFDSKVLSALKKDGRYPLDPALMTHIKHRGVGTEAYGESLLAPAMGEIAYKRMLQALDVVTVESLLNRLVVIKVGSDDKESLYHPPEVANSRQQLLARYFQKMGPSGVILWAGPDLSIEEVGAHGKILEMDERYRLADKRIRDALGVPSALLTGEGSDGKSSGYAATLGVAATMRELQNQYKEWLESVAEQIAEENNFKDVEVTWNFHQDLLADKEVNANVAVKAYQLGMISTTTALEEMGISPEAEENRMAEDVSKGYRDEAFGLPKGVSKQQAGAQEGGVAPGTGGGRPKGNGKRDPREKKETKTPEENR